MFICVNFQKYYRLGVNRGPIRPTSDEERIVRRRDSDEEPSRHLEFSFDDDDEDSDHRHDNDSRSIEIYSRRSRFRRFSSPQGATSNPSVMAGGSSQVNVSNDKVLQLANFAAIKMDELSSQPTRRKVDTILEAFQKVS